MIRVYINHVLKIEVVEPRNFCSSDGENLFYCTVIDMNNTEDKELYLAESSSYFEIKNDNIDYVILQKRGYLDNNHYNIFTFKDIYDIERFGIDKDVSNKIEQKMIGLVTDIIR